MVHNQLKFQKWLPKQLVSKLNHYKKIEGEKALHRPQFIERNTTPKTNKIKGRNFVLFDTIRTIKNYSISHFQ